MEKTWQQQAHTSNKQALLHGQMSTQTYHISCNAPDILFPGFATTALIKADVAVWRSCLLQQPFKLLLTRVTGGMTSLRATTGRQSDTVFTGKNARAQRASGATEIRFSTANAARTLLPAAQQLSHLGHNNPEALARPAGARHRCQASHRR